MSIEEMIDRAIEDNTVSGDAMRLKRRNAIKPEAVLSCGCPRDGRPQYGHIYCDWVTCEDHRLPEFRRGVGAALGGAETDMKTHVRHRTPPVPNGCRWCGVEQRGHAWRWVQSKRWHGWESPTPAQRRARLRARRGIDSRMIAGTVPDSDGSSCV